MVRSKYGFASICIRLSKNNLPLRKIIQVIPSTNQHLFSFLNDAGRVKPNFAEVY